MGRERVTQWNVPADEMNTFFINVAQHLTRKKTVIQRKNQVLY